MKNSDRICCITNSQGDITFASKSFLEIYGATRKKTLGRRINSNYMLYPLGSLHAVQHLSDISSGKLEEATVELISFNQNNFIVSTIIKYPQIDKGKIIGIVNEMDSSLEQFKKNKCLNVIKKANYKGITLNRKEIKLTMILAHFQKISGPEIADLLDIKLNSVYMYKSNLVSKIKAANHNDNCCFVEVMRTILLHGLFKDHKQLVCIPHNELVCSENIDLQSLKTEIKFYEKMMKEFNM